MVRLICREENRSRRKFSPRQRRARVRRMNLAPSRSTGFGRNRLYSLLGNDRKSVKNSTLYGTCARCRVSQSGAAGTRATQTGSPKGEARGSERIKRPTDFLSTLLTASTNIGSLLCDGIG